MAKPDCDDGWIKISVELEAALDFADFTKMARTILRYAFLQLFGGGKRPTHAIINCTEIAEQIGVSKQLVSRGLQQLTASGVLVKLDATPNTYRFIKNYERWTKAKRGNGNDFAASGKPLLSPAEIANCKASPAYARSFYIPSTRAPKANRTVDTQLNRTVDEAHTERLTEPEAEKPNGCHAVHRTVDELSTERLTKSSPPNNPLVGNAEAEAEEYRLLPNGKHDESCEKVSGKPEKRSRQKQPLLAVMADRPEDDDSGMASVRKILLGATRDAKHPDGNPTFGAGAVKFLLECRAKGHDDSVTEAAILKAVRKGLPRQPVAMRQYALKVLGSLRSELGAVPVAVKPSQTRPIEYHVAPPRPQFPPRDPRS